MKKILISTVYEPFTNLGSFLQTYALYTFLRDNGYDVQVIEKNSVSHSLRKTILKLNPRRQFFLRLKKGFKGFLDIRQLPRISKSNVNDNPADILICGSDEIWNLDNAYFKDLMFWGGNINVAKKIAYAVSAGSMSQQTLLSSAEHVAEIKNFDFCFPRDIHTKGILQNILTQEFQLVGDPTLLVPVSKISRPIKLPKQKYLLVYTYGLPNNYIEYVKKFAADNNLIIISPCFWHTWADKVIECSALQFSTLIAGAEYVFTTTFHGAIFAMLNHTNCAILPIRDKVKDIAIRLSCEERLVSDSSSYSQFTDTMSKPFNTDAFERTLSQIRETSIKLLTNAINS
jgi:hypothetical protein